MSSLFNGDIDYSNRAIASLRAPRSRPARGSGLPVVGTDTGVAPGPIAGTSDAGGDASAAGVSAGAINPTGLSGTRSGRSGLQLPGDAAGVTVEAGAGDSGRSSASGPALRTCCSPRCASSLSMNDRSLAPVYCRRYASSSGVESADSVTVICSLSMAAVLRLPWQLAWRNRWRRSRGRWRSKGRP